MVFGWGRRTAGAQETAVLADAGLVTEPSAAAVLTGSDVSDVAWAPLPADDASKQFKEPLPYQIKQHDVKSRLQVSSVCAIGLPQQSDVRCDTAIKRANQEFRS